jgi:hypothetical protein
MKTAEELKGETDGPQPLLAGDKIKSSRNYGAHSVFQ